MGSPKTVQAPDPIDPNQSMGQYLFGNEFESSGKGVTDDYFQQQLLDAESKYRPEYTALELADINTMAYGTEDQAGLFDLLEGQSKQAGELQRDELNKQRADDVAALQEFSPSVTQAYRDADPYSTELADLQSQQAKDIIEGGASDAENLLGERGMEFAASTGELTPLEKRNAEQQARISAQARGREMGSMGEYSELQSRMAEELNKRERELQLGSSLLGQQSGMQQQRFGQGQQALQSAYGMQRGISGDLGATILGRPSQSIGLGGQMLGYAQQGASGQMGPQLFDPNVGLNMAMQDQSNQMQANVANSANQAAYSGGLFGAAGSATGMFNFGSCWVAREVFGETNPKWEQFRDWLTQKAPRWFHDLYMKHGESFALFISDKPLLKLIVRTWMNSRIK